MGITLLKHRNYFKKLRQVTKHVVLLPPLTQLYFIRFLVIIIQYMGKFQVRFLYIQKSKTITVLYNLTTNLVNAFAFQ